MKVNGSGIIHVIKMMDQYSEYFLDKETGEIEWVSDKELSDDSRIQ